MAGGYPKNLSLGEFAISPVTEELKVKGTKMTAVQNMAVIVISIADTKRYALPARTGHANALRGRPRSTQGKYGSAKLTNLQVARVLAHKDPARNFFQKEQEFLDSHPRVVQSVVKKNTTVTNNGLKVNWTAVKNALVERAKKDMAKGAFGFAPIKKSTKKRRIAAGIKPSPPLYASGQLAKAIIGKVEGFK